MTYTKWLSQKEIKKEFDIFLFPPFMKDLYLNTQSTILYLLADSNGTLTLTNQVW